MTALVSTISRRRDLVADLIAFFATLAIAALVARPITAASVAFDSQAAALHFDRIVTGHKLELFLSTTPKPLLTLVYGSLYEATRDWRLIAWAAILADAGAVALTAHFVRRQLGWPAWAFAAAALAGCLALIYDTGFALATPWALLFIAAAAILATADRVRPFLAGLCLLCAVLVRLETLFLVGAIAALLAWQLLWRAHGPGNRRSGPRERRVAAASASETRDERRRASRDRRGVVWWRDRLALVVLAAAAIPVMMLHDWLLAGDPTFWLSVAVRYSETTTNAIRGPVAQLGWLANRYLHVLLPLTIVGAIGVARLVQLRCWRIVGPVVALGGGTAVFLMVLAVRHIYVPLRYTAPIDIAVIVAASAAPGWILDVVARTSRARAGARAGPPSRAFRDLPGAVAAAAVLGVLVAWPYGVLHRVDIQRITDNRDVARNLARVTPLIAAELDRIPGARDWSLTTSPLPGGLPILVVTGAVIPRVSLDLDVPLTRLAALAPERVVPDQGLPAVGQIVFHDRNVDKRFPPIEISEPTRYGAGEAVPLAVDRARKYWLIAFRPS